MIRTLPSPSRLTPDVAVRGNIAPMALPSPSQRASTYRFTGDERWYLRMSRNFIRVVNDENLISTKIVMVLKNCGPRGTREWRR